jgi:hypothetical protein
VSVGFLSTEYPSEPSGYLVTKTSRHCSDPLVSISIVNLIFVCMLLSCLWNFCSSSTSCGQITKVSSTYLYQQDGFLGTVFSTCCSKSSVK